MKFSLSSTVLLALLFFLPTGVRANPGLVIQRSGWDWDRADIMWMTKDGKAPDKKEGRIPAGGWADYDINVPETGWYELVLQGDVNAEHDVYVDGKLISSGTLGEEDVISKKPLLYGQASLPLSSGTHCLRLRRLNFPGCLPAAWELRKIDGDATRQVTAAVKGFNILRVGEKLKLEVTGGGTAKAETYQLMTCNTAKPSDAFKPAASVSFPASEKFVTRSVEVPCGTEGIFKLYIKAGDKLARYAESGNIEYVVIDTRHAPAVPAEARKVLLHDIDCVAQTDMGRPLKTGEDYWEANGATRITRSPAGAYRESGDNLDPNIPAAPNTLAKSLAGFSYKIDVPEAQAPYLLEVDYPDDDRRTANVIVLENWIAGGHSYPHTQMGSGYETGDWYPLTNKMLTHQVVFWAGSKEARAAIMSMNPGMRAAVARIRVYRLEDGLPAGPKGRPDGRIAGSWFEEPGRWGAHLRSGGTLETDFIGIERWIQLCRWVGMNCISPTEVVYGFATYHTNVLEGFTDRPYDAPRISALLCEKYGLKYIPELHIGGNRWFETRVILKSVPNPDELYIYDCYGHRAANVPNSPAWNVLHPALQKKYIEIFGELADKLSDSPALGGISNRLIQWCGQSWNGIPSLHWGYGDFTIRMFEKETGIKVPGADGDPKRFEQRFAFLTVGDMREKWVSWRCAKVLNFYCRLRDRIREHHPDAILYFRFFPVSGGVLDDKYESISTTPYEQLREVGIDLKSLEKVPGIAIMPISSFGRRNSSPEADQKEIDNILDPARKAIGFGQNRAYAYGNEYFEVHQRVPIDKLGFPNLKPGDYTGAAEAGGRNGLERLSVVLADQDTGTFLQGGLGYTFGQPKTMNEWLGEYTRLPRLPFTPLQEARDPVAVWFRQCDDGFYFYAVNREAYPVKINLTLRGAKKVESLGLGKAVDLEKGGLALELDAFQLRAFKAASGASITGAETIVPEDRIQLVRERLAYCERLAEEINTGTLHDEVSDVDRSAFLANVNIAWTAFQQKSYWRARTALAMRSMVRVFDKLDAYPPGFFARSNPAMLRSKASSPFSPSGALMLTGSDLQGKLAQGSKAELADSTTIDPGWDNATILKPVSGEMTFDLEAPVPGQYQLSLGSVATSPTSVNVTLGNRLLGEITIPAKALKQPGSTQFPILDLPQGTVRVSLKGTGDFGLYGAVFQPVYRPIQPPQWSTIGPFPATWIYGSKTLERVVQDMQHIFPPETEMKLDAVYKGSGDREVRWDQSDSLAGIHSRGNPEDTVNFTFRSPHVTEKEVCYAVTFVTSPEERSAELYLGCDWWANVYLNGEIVKSDIDAKVAADCGAQFNAWHPIRAKITLKKGENTLLVKCHGGEDGNWFSAFISDPGDLKFSPLPQAGIAGQ